MRSYPNTQFVYKIATLVTGAAIGFSAAAQEFIVKLKPSTSFVNMTAQVEATPNVKVVDQHAPGKLLLVSVPQEDSAKSLSNLVTSGQVEYAVPNIKLHAFELSDDPMVSKQWALKKIQAQAAWTKDTGSEEVVVAVIDTGIDWKHEDLEEQIWVNKGEIANNQIDDDGNGFVDDIRGWDFRENDNNPHDDTSSKNPGHGTHCAGIVGARGNNQIGISGIAQVVSLMPIRFLGADGSGDLLSAAKAIDYATNNGADVISASWGAAVMRSQVRPILEAIERAKEKGVVFVAAAANDGRSNDKREVYPANAGISNVISVAASNPNDEKPSWSNFGRAKVDLASPGEGILSTLPNNQYKNLSGTSMATPLVAGLVALLIAQGEKLDVALKPHEIKAVLQASAEKVSIETACDCRISAANALDHMIENKLTVVPNALTIEPKGEKAFYAIGGKGPYEFSSSDPKVATITKDGTFAAVAKGKTTISVKDASGTEAMTHNIFVGMPEGGGGDGGQCPFKVPQLCDILCKYRPQLPWCS